MALGTAAPLLVYGPRSSTYDFGPWHPLTPRRFGPGIDLLGALGAEPGLAPEPAPDEDLLACHTARYLAVVKAFSAAPWRPSEAGIGSAGDNPAFAGMHEAAAAVAGGSLRAMEAILRGDVEHAIHPGGGLHHAMASRASGFCIYDDPALAVARARREGLRVLYVDLDVHHGDGVQALHWNDPGVLTLSFHETGHYLFPGTGFVGELGDGEAAGTSVNVPLEPPSGDDAWLAAVRSLLPALAAAFAPDIVVSQHGADSHAWDPLAHLRVTTTATTEAARLVDAVAHRYAGGRWLATGGGGYDAYRVVPRTWAATWLAGAHREIPTEMPLAWRERWSSEAEQYGQAPLPTKFADPPNAGLPRDAEQEVAERASLETLGLVRRLVLPAILRTAQDRGWWSFGMAHGGRQEMGLAPRTLGVADPADAAAILDGARRAGATIVERRNAGMIVGVAVAIEGADGAELLALGVAPDHRGRGIGTELLADLASRVPGPLRATVAAGERDPVAPVARRARAEIARRMLERAGFEIRPPAGELGRADAEALEGRRG